MSRKKEKRNTYLNLILWLFIIVNVNLIGSYIFERIDLTSEKRFTLSETTLDMLNELDDYIYLTIYLEGDLNSGFKRLRNSIKEMLDEFSVIAKNNIEYEFINPLKGKDDKARNEIGRQLMKKGLMPTNLQEKDSEGNTSQKIIFPGAIMTYKGRETAIDFLENKMGHSPEQNLNLSTQDIEYKLVKAIRDLQKKEKPKIAFIEGHGELDDLQLYDIINSLSEFYTVEFIKLDGQLNSLRERMMIDSVKSKVVNRYQAIIIAKPDSVFSKNDKFIIDQFIINGGKSLWLIDGTTIDMDSLSYQGSSIALVKQINIEDQLFKYGVRINPDLIQDIQCAMIPVNTAVVGAEPNFSPVPWLYFPLITPNNTHPITKNMDLIKTEFVSTIDTVGEDPNISKTFLLHTSQYTKVVNAPIRVDLRLVSQEPDKRQFIKSHKPIAVLLSGKFESLFNNRLEPEFEENNLIDFKAYGKPTKMIVVSDGDIIKNNADIKNGKYMPLPLGLDFYFRDIYYGGNKEFILNAVNYLCDDAGIMSVRSRELKLRLMDRAKINDEKLKWQIINIILPVLIVIIFGFIIRFVRKRKYAKV